MALTEEVIHAVKDKISGKKSNIKFTTYNNELTLLADSIELKFSKFGTLDMNLYQGVTKVMDQQHFLHRRCENGDSINLLGMKILIPISITS